MIINVAPLLKQPVGAQMEYRLGEDPIDPRGDNAGLRDAGAQSIETHLKATHTNPGAYLEGEARATVELQCSRCLRPTPTSVVAEFAEQYYSTIAVIAGEEIDEPPEDAKTIGSDFRIDLTPLLREELILATPQIALHDPACRGLCPVCGEDLNVRPHQHDEAVDGRGARLAALKDFRADRE